MVSSETGSTQPAADAAKTDEGPEAQFVNVATEVVKPEPTAAVATRGGGKPKVVIIGGGFGGMSAARKFADANVEVTLVDQRNYHLFAPLLYQVATGQLSPSHIATPIRSMLKRQKNTKVVLGTVETIDPEGKAVTLADGTVLPYDYLIVAVGATHSYFGRDEWAPLAPGMKTIEDAERIRRNLLAAYEQAEKETDPARRKALMTFVVVGGGPTGVELAGAIGELAHHTLVNDYKNIDTRQSRIYLVEALPRILPMYDEDLAATATKSLNGFGVEVKTNSMVTNIDETGLNMGDTRIDAETIIWAAGVQVSPLTRQLAGVAELDRAGRVPVTSELHVAGHPELFVIGDAASVKNAEGKPVPGVAPAAIQQGEWAATNITNRIAGKAYQPFVYKNRGSLAVIGRNAAIADINGKKFSGPAAWFAWMGIHDALLPGIKNRIAVFTQWVTNYFSFNRASRLMTGDDKK
ncbi:MAG: NAD(P)/FAD-dependent oxidoreductase [Thermomicrobiales bacterium]